MSLEKRMYSLNLYNISPIQAGIQSGHSNSEYIFTHFHDEDLQDWGKNWKTVVLLNGGTSNSGKESYYGYAPAKGSMETHLETLKNNDVKVVPFYEPDLNYCLSSMSFIVDERVFNRRKYPDFDYIAYSLIPLNSLKDLEGLDSAGYTFEPSFQTWLESIGGRTNLFLRLFLRGFDLARN